MITNESLFQIGRYAWVRGEKTYIVARNFSVSRITVLGPCYDASSIWVAVSKQAWLDEVKASQERGEPWLMVNKAKCTRRIALSEVSKVTDD